MLRVQFFLVQIWIPTFSRCQALTRLNLTPFILLVQRHKFSSSAESAWARKRRQWKETGSQLHWYSRRCPQSSHKVKADTRAKMHLSASREGVKIQKMDVTCSVLVALPTRVAVSSYRGCENELHPVDVDVRGRTKKLDMSGDSELSVMAAVGMRLYISLVWEHFYCLVAFYLFQPLSFWISILCLFTIAAPPVAMGFSLFLWLSHSTFFQTIFTCSISLCHCNEFSFLLLSLIAHFLFSISTCAVTWTIETQ